MRYAKRLLIATLLIVQTLSLLHFAAAASMARGRFNDVHAPEFSAPGNRIFMSATAVNDGDSGGWFRICFIRVGPLISEYFPSHWTQVRDEQAVHCSETLPTAAGTTYTFESNKFLMQSVPSVTFWVLLTVQQEQPIAVGGDDAINMTVDDLRVVVVTNLFQT